MTILTRYFESIALYSLVSALILCKTLQLNPFYNAIARGYFLMKLIYMKILVFFHGDVMTTILTL
jgi:hypothetical protein